MTTTNQIKQYAKQNQYIKDYCSEHDVNKYWKLLKRTIVVKNRNWDTDIITFQSNSRYYYAHKEFKRRFGDIAKHTHHKVEFEGYFWGYWTTIEIDGTVRINLNDCRIDDDTWFRRLPFIDDWQLNFNYTGKLCEENYHQTVIKEINKYLYAPGKFRDIQLYKNCTKSDVKRYYKYWMQDKTMQDYDEYEIEKHIRRYYNIDISGVYFQDAINWIQKKGKRFKTLVKLCKFDYSFMWDFDGDIDEAEELFWDEMDQYPKNAILI
jgi:hypothetical protein